MRKITHRIYNCLALSGLLLLGALPLSAGDAQAVLPPEPEPQVVTQKIDLLQLMRDDKMDYYIGQSYDVKDDPKEIYKLLPDGMLRVSGRGYGGMTTKESFKDYHLVIEFKWGEMTWGKRAKATRDNGVLVHCFGPQGAQGDAWMASIEAQIIEGGVGDILVLSPKLKDGTVLQASISAEVGRDRDKERVWTPGAERVTMTGGRLNWEKRDVDWKDKLGFRGKDDVESPFGQWTRMEVIAKGDTLVYYVNGVLVNRAFEVKPSAGKILLQTEAAEMFVRRYELYPLDTFKETWPPKADTSKKDADQKNDNGHGQNIELPDYAKRPVVMNLSKEQATVPAPPYKLPAGFEMVVAAYNPMVANPTMGCVDDRGRLFVGDSAGVNWNTKKFEELLPNRVLMLEDKDGDGIFEHSTVFADKLTVPKGGCWANGSLYVASPPGIWKFTDKDDDGIAEERELVIDGFAWTANGADCHGPRLHPNGRLYWTHGRKGHTVKQKDGTLVHKGLNSGIWSMLPDGTDVRWHALGCADNPVGLDFTPSGDLIGTCDLYFGSPRVDTIMHWQLGGVYERPDYLRIIADLPRTHEHMPILKELGHVVPSGSCFWESANAVAPAGQAWSADASNLQYLVAFYNSKTVKRFELFKHGSTYGANENEFFSVERSGAHLSDVIEAPDGSLLIIDTGTWYSHCPSSLLNSANVPGQIYRIRRTAEGKSQHDAVLAQHKPQQIIPPRNAEAILPDLKSSDPMVMRRALEDLAFHKFESPLIASALLDALAVPADPVLEHALLVAGMTCGNFEAQKLNDIQNTVQQARLLRIVSQTRKNEKDFEVVLKFALDNLATSDARLAENAYLALIKAPQIDRILPPVLANWLGQEKLASEQIAALEKCVSALAGKPGVANIVAAMLGHQQQAVNDAGLRAISAQTGKVNAQAWADGLSQLLNKQPTALVLDAIARVKDKQYDDKLNAIAADTAKDAPLRLKALLALSSSGKNVSDPAFTLLMELLSHPSDGGLRLEAAQRLANSSLSEQQWDAFLNKLPSTGPLEQSELLVAMALPEINRGIKYDLAKKIAEAYAKSPMLGTFRQDLVRKAFSFTKRDVYEILEPAFKKALEANNAKQERMDALAVAAQKEGNPAAGKQVYESGRGICLSCHKIGDIGREIGPNLSKIGGIRTERELIESILFPNNNIARDYDLFSFALTDGSTALGLIKARGEEGITITEISGQTRLLPADAIKTSTMMTNSLMPAGLDGTLSPQELLDLVAYLRSLK